MTGMSTLPAILSRIEDRLKKLGLKETTAAKAAGKPDAIRNLKRAIKNGNRTGISSTTAEALARVLKTNTGWLLTGAGDPEASSTSWQSKAPLTDDEWTWLVVEASYLTAGMGQDESHALAQLAREVCEDPLIRPGDLIEARRAFSAALVRKASKQ